MGGREFALHLFFSFYHTLYYPIKHIPLKFALREYTTYTPKETPLYKKDTYTHPPNTLYNCIYIEIVRNGEG